MRGGFLHNSVLLDPLEEHFLRLGAKVHREFRIPSSRILGFVDLYVEFEELRICCEAELSADRVLNDVCKAVEIAAHELLIVVPRPGLARSIQRRIRLEGGACQARLMVVVLPLGSAMQHVRAAFPFPPGLIAQGKSTLAATPRETTS